MHFFLFTGPKLPMPLFRHAMVQLGKGQAIIGGYGDGDGNSQDKIYIFSCINRNCSIRQLSQKLSLPIKTRHTKEQKRRTHELVKSLFSCDVTSIVSAQVKLT